MKIFLSLLLFLAIMGNLYSQDLKSVALNAPDKTRGLPIMQAFDRRASASVFTSEKLKLQDLSDLLWAANGINRPGLKKRTAPSAMNAQDIDIYVFMAAMDAGLVSQNISLFCAGTELSTRPRATMDNIKLKEILKLKDSQHPMLNNPVSYPQK